MSVLATKNLRDHVVPAVVPAAAAGVFAAVTKTVNPLFAVAFAVASFAIDRLLGHYYNMGDPANQRNHKTENSNKQMIRFAATVLGGSLIMGLNPTALAFMLTQGGVMLAQRAALWIKVEAPVQQN